jgi:hypothetical protein
MMNFSKDNLITVDKAKVKPWSTAIKVNDMVFVLNSGENINMDVSETTATPDDVLSGKLFFNAQGQLSEGSLIRTTSTDFSPTTAIASDVRQGKKFFSDRGVLIEGTLNPKASEVPVGESLKFYKCISVTPSQEDNSIIVSGTSATWIGKEIDGTYTLSDPIATGFDRIWINDSGLYLSAYYHADWDEHRWGISDRYQFDGSNDWFDNTACQADFRLDVDPWYAIWHKANLGEDVPDPIVRHIGQVEINDEYIIITRCGTSVINGIYHKVSATTAVDWDRKWRLGETNYYILTDNYKHWGIYEVTDHGGTMGYSHYVIYSQYFDSTYLNPWEVPTWGAVWGDSLNPPIVSADVYKTIRVDNVPSNFFNGYEYPDGDTFITAPSDVAAREVNGRYVLKNADEPMEDWYWENDAGCCIVSGSTGVATIYPSYDCRNGSPAIMAIAEQDENSVSILPLIPVRPDGTTYDWRKHDGTPLTSISVVWDNLKVVRTPGSWTGSEIIFNENTKQYVITDTKTTDLPCGDYFTPEINGIYDKDVKIIIDSLYKDITSNPDSGASYYYCVEGPGTPPAIEVTGQLPYLEQTANGTYYPEKDPDRPSFYRWKCTNSTGTYYIYRGQYQWIIGPDPSIPEEDTIWVADGGEMSIRGIYKVTVETKHKTGKERRWVKGTCYLYYSEADRRWCFNDNGIYLAYAVSDKDHPVEISSSDWQPESGSWSTSLRVSGHDTALFPVATQPWRIADPTFGLHYTEYGSNAEVIREYQVKAVQPWSYTWKAYKVIPHNNNNAYTSSSTTGGSFVDYYTCDKSKTLDGTFCFGFVPEVGKIYTDLQATRQVDLPVSVISKK